MYGHTMGDQVLREMILEDQASQSITVASLLHDSDKIAAPNDIVQQPGRLTAAEWDGAGYSTSRRVSTSSWRNKRAR